MLLFPGVDIAESPKHNKITEKFNQPVQKDQPAIPGRIFLIQDQSRNKRRNLCRKDQFCKGGQMDAVRVLFQQGNYLRDDQ